MSVLSFVNRIQFRYTVYFTIARLILKKIILRKRQFFIQYILYIYKNKKEREKKIWQMFITKF